MIDHLLPSWLEPIPDGTGPRHGTKRWYDWVFLCAVVKFAPTSHYILIEVYFIFTTVKLRGLFSSSVNHCRPQYQSDVWIQTPFGISSEYQWKTCHSCVCTVSLWMLSATVYILAVCCPSVLWLRKAPTDNRLLTGWWLRKATRGGVVMATEACQTDCVEIGQVCTHNQYPPHTLHPSTPIWHFRHWIFAV